MMGLLERKARGSVGFGGSAIASPTSSHWLAMYRIR